MTTSSCARQGTSASNNSTCDHFVSAYHGTPTQDEWALGLSVNCAGHFISASHAQKDRLISSFVLIYCIAGEGSFCVGDKRSVQAGDIFCLPPDIPHSYACSSDLGWDIWWAHVEGTLAKNLVSIAGLAHPFIRRVGIQPSLIENFAMITAVLQHKQPHYALDTVRHAVNLFLDIRKLGESSRVHDRLLDGITYQTASLEEAAGQCGYSPYHYIRHFKREFGITPWRYILMLKVDKAKELLADPRVPIKAIAHTVGIDDPNYFSRLFKKLTGLTPKAFRELMQV